MRILVTGAGGLLGLKIVEEGLKRGYDVYATYLSHKPNVKQAIKLDITEKESVIKAINKIHPDAIIHCAALTDVDLCEKNFELAMKVNLYGVRHIVEAAKRMNSYLIFISTDYVFDGKKGLYREEDKPNPINNYGHLKLQAEKEVLASGLSSLIVRPSVIYGSKPAGGKVNFALWILKNLRENQEIKVLIDQYVSPTLNINLAKMILEACEKKLEGIYHMAGAERVSRYEFAIRLAKTFNLDLSLIKTARINEMNWLAKRPKDSSLNVSKVANTLKEKPLKLEDALKILKEELENASRNNY